VHVTSASAGDYRMVVAVLNAGRKNRLDVLAAPNRAL
jgi:hypothetical protein